MPTKSAFIACLVKNNKLSSGGGGGGNNYGYLIFLLLPLHNFLPIGMDNRFT